MAVSQTKEAIEVKGVMLSSVLYDWFALLFESVNVSPHETSGEKHVNNSPCDWRERNAKAAD